MSNTTSNSEFKEFEVKYLLDDTFDAEAFFADLRSQHGVVEKHVDVTDTYYRFETMPDLICRHRHDVEIQQLTVKSYGGDTRDRMEVNLQLDNSASQKRTVEAFLGSFGQPVAFEIRKKVDIFDFPDCEIVHYIAQANDKRVRCVEFEAVGAADWSSAWEIIKRYAGASGFLNKTRCEISLFDLLSR
jgi:hypothetical protein